MPEPAAAAAPTTELVLFTNIPVGFVDAYDDFGPKREVVPESVLPENCVGFVPNPAGGCVAPYGGWDLNGMRWWAGIGPDGTPQLAGRGRPIGWWCYYSSGGGRWNMKWRHGRSTPCGISSMDSGSPTAGAWQATHSSYAREPVPELQVCMPLPHCWAHSAALLLSCRCLLCFQDTPAGPGSRCIRLLSLCTRLRV